MATCDKYRIDKSNSLSRSIHATVSVQFKCGEYVIEYCDTYTYLGLWFTEHCNMKKTVNELTKSASRELSALYLKSVNAGGFTFSGTDTISWWWCVEYIGV
jgi:hypothetical protein